MPYVPPTRWIDVPAAVRAALENPFIKRADGELQVDDQGVPGLTHLADVMGFRAGNLNSNWGGPRPVSNLIIGAGLGGLGGYGVGRLAEQILPERYFDRGVLRKRTAQLGALAGAVPAMWQGYDNYRQSGGDISSVADRWPLPSTEAGIKASADLFAPVINRDEFNQDVMDFEGTPMKLRAATAGLVEAASATSGSSIVTPWDIARIAVGAGSGLVSGMIAGKALGYLAGLNEAGQSALKGVGAWTGILNAVVPRALGLR